MGERALSLYSRLVVLGVLLLLFVSADALAKHKSVKARSLGDRGQQRIAADPGRRLLRTPFSPFLSGYG